MTVSFHSYYWPLKFVCAFLIPLTFSIYGLGATWQTGILNVIMSWTFIYNYTWLVNSAAHIYGSKPFDT